MLAICDESEDHTLLSVIECKLLFSQYRPSYHRYHITNSQCPPLSLHLLPNPQAQLQCPFTHLTSFQHPHIVHPQHHHTHPSGKHCAPLANKYKNHPPILPSKTIRLRPAASYSSFHLPSLHATSLTKQTAQQRLAVSHFNTLTSHFNLSNMGPRCSHCGNNFTGATNVCTCD